MDGVFVSRGWRMTFAGGRPVSCNPGELGEVHQHAAHCVLPEWCGHGSRFEYVPGIASWRETNARTGARVLWAPEAPPRVVVLVRGEAFRRGGRFSRDTTASGAAQLACLRSIERHVVRPLVDRRCTPVVVADVVIGDAAREGAFRAEFARLFGATAAVRVRRHVLANMHAGLLSSLDLLPDGHEGRIVLTRPDLAWHADVPYRLDDTAAIETPFLEPARYGSGARMVCDMLLVLQSTHLPELRRHLQRTGDRSMRTASLHWLSKTNVVVPMVDAVSAVSRGRTHLYRLG